ncbi:MAG TPA: alpha/beta fold hydrolase [Burkholderiaceae bacterium]|nr:alpha/beta fold hydrolase [Burkholderiaceae bacterium]
MTSSISAASGMLVAACASTQADSRTTAKRPVLLVHGAWHGAWCWGKVAPMLAAAGHPVVAIDLPGHGLNALFPVAYDVQPRPGAFATERSPLAAITLADYANAVAAAVESLLAAGFPAPMVVGHSMGGGAIQAAAELLGPAKIARLVYVAAFMPKDGTSMLSYTRGAEAPPSQLVPLLRADPQAIGALRFDPGSLDSQYRAAMADVFYGKVDLATRRAALNLLTCDIPAAPMATPVAVSNQRWGSIPRTYVRAAQDKAIPPVLQDRMIAQADAMTPSNRTQVVQLDSDHSPFFSMPDPLARVLLSAV